MMRPIYKAVIVAMATVVISTIVLIYFRPVAEGAPRIDSYDRPSAQDLATLQLVVQPDPTLLGAIASCLSEQNDSHTCIGVTTGNSKYCTYSQEACRNSEAIEWTALTQNYIRGITQNIGNSAELSAAQIAWEEYAVQDCSFIRIMWQRDYVMQHSELASCNLQHAGDRAIELRNDLINILAMGDRQ